LVQAEGEVEALGVVVATSVLDGEGVTPEPLDGVLLRIVLGDSQRFEFVREEQVAKPRREGGEAVVVACGGGLLPLQFFNLLAGIEAALRGSGGVAIRVASAAAIASATGPSVGPTVGASAITASATRVAMRDDLTIATSSCSAVATLRGSAGCCTSTVGIGRQLDLSTVTTEIRAATCGFVVTVPSGGRLSNPVVNSREVGIFCKLGDDFSCTHPLSLACYRCDRHEALLWGSVYPTLDLVESLCKVADGEVVSKTPASFVPLSVTLTSSVLVGVGLIHGCVDSQLVCGDVFKVSVACCP
jgi:hypothetical protein